MIRRDDLSIHILPARLFRKLMIENQINDTNVEERDSLAMISISEPNSPEEYCYFREDHNNIKRFFFYDIDEEHKDYPRFSREDAKRMFDFIVEKLQDPKVKKFIIHCHAGISRSGAVGEFIQELIGMDYFEFHTQHPHILPNGWVKKLLNAEYRNFRNSDVC